jgi:uncharacterized protein YuzE
MKIRYDVETDTLTIRLNTDTIAESDESSDGVIHDYSAEGRLVALEIQQASLRTENPYSIELQVAPTQPKPGIPELA